MEHLGRWLGGLSIVHGPLYVALIVALICGLLLLMLRGRGRRWTVRMLLAGIGAAVLLGGYWLLLAIAKPWPDPLPLTVWVWIGLGLLGVTLFVASWRRRQHWWPRLGAAVTAVVVVVVAAAGVNAVYGSYPTVASAMQLPPQDSVAAGTVLDAAQPVDATVPELVGSRRATHDLPAHGAVFQANIPPTRSGFHARAAWIYVPPAYLTPRPPRLPVLVLVGGQPGSPRDWLDGGRIAERMDTWAAAHHGRAPIVVMPDALGSRLANPLCMDSRLGQADTYLSKDVLDWVTTHLRVDENRAHWAVGGFSFGGTCALQLALAHPTLFPTLFDASGQRGPTLGSRADTVAATFGGNQAAFTAVDPLHELATRRYPSSAAVFVVGKQDHIYGPQQHTVAAAARAAGMSVRLQSLTGGHNWNVSGPAVTDDLPWLTTTMGLTP